MLGLRAGVQRRRPRALRPLEPAQPERPRGDGLARHRAEPQPQPRLHEGRRARDAGDAAAAERVGSDPLRRPARHRRRAVRARRRRSRSSRHWPAMPALRAAAGPARRAECSALTRAGLLPLDFYPSFARDDDPVSGFAVGVRRRASRHGYWALRNRSALLVETHSWKDYPTRVRVTHNMHPRDAGDDGAAGRARGARLRRGPTRRAQLGGRRSRSIYQTSARTRDDRLPRLCLHARAVGDLRRPGHALRPDEAAGLARAPVDQSCRSSPCAAPRGGYVVPAAQAAWVGEKLRCTVSFERLRRPVRRRALETFRATTVAFAGTVRGPARRDARGRVGGGDRGTCPPARCSCRSRSRTRGC